MLQRYKETLMSKDTKQKREVTESTATQFVMVKDKTGKKYYCLISDLKDPSSLSDKEKQYCIGDFEEE